MSCFFGVKDYSQRLKAPQLLLFNFSKKYEIESFRGISRSQSNIKDGAFCENNLKLKPVDYFRKKLHSYMFSYVVNVPLSLVINDALMNVQM